jgi:hypothetical protein
MALIDVRPFHASDLLSFAVQPEQRAELPGDAGDAAVQLMMTTPAPVSLVTPCGKVVMVGGISEGDPAMATALVSTEAGPWMTGIVRAFHRWIVEQGRDGVVMGALPGFAAAARFARLLGFVPLGSSANIGPDNMFYDLYLWGRL